MTESLLPNLRKRLPHSQPYVNQLMILSILFLLFSVAVAPDPLICNRNTYHQCVCGKRTSEPNLPLDCDEFIQAESLLVVDMRAKHIDLTTKLHRHDQTFEDYFKKRIAQLVSSYCENGVNECPGVSLKITKNDARMSDENFVFYATDENDPLLSQENVILLKVEKEADNITRILFIISKSTNTEAITEKDIMDSNQVKIILGSQAIPLARILGGIKLDSVRVSRIRRDLPARADSGGNRKLITMASIVGIFFLICYIVGGYKIYKLCKDKRNKTRKEKEALAANSTTPNYGTLNNQKVSRNGSISQKQLEAAFESEYRSIDEPIPDQDPNEPRHLTEREARFMFMCDPSQLPREPTFDSTNDLDRVTEQKEKTPLSTHEVINEEEEIQSKADAEWQSKEKETIPQLVIVPSLSMCEQSPAASPAPNQPEVKAHLRSESPPVVRPQSRRGSRVDEEEIDLTEIGASKDIKDMFTDLVVPDNIEPHIDRPDSVDKWSSSEGEVDVYYKMSDDEECKGDDWNANNNNVKKPSEEQLEESDADVEEDKVKEEADAFVYERLREDLSPQPPVNDPTS